MSRLLLLAGTGEAWQMAKALADAGVELVVSAYEATRVDKTLACDVREGGFGGDAGFEAFLNEAGIGAVLDATHPFAERVTRRSARICAARGIHYALYWRPEWKPHAGDRWTQLASEAEAAEHIAPGSTVFVATGRGTLEGYATLEDCTVIARRIGDDAGDFPLPKGRFLASKGPFTPEGEKQLFAELGVDWLVLRNAGSKGAEPKLVAARELGLPVGMIRRPEPPEGVRLLDTVEDAIAWGRAYG